MRRIGLLLTLSVMTMGVLFAQKSPNAQFEKKIHDFGTVKEEIGAVTTSFEFVNTGDAPLVIQRVTATCGCTTPKYTREPILPGDTGQVDVRYSTFRRPGNFRKNVRVYTNVPDSVFVLTVRGRVTPRERRVQ